MKELLVHHVHYSLSIGLLATQSQPGSACLASSTYWKLPLYLYAALTKQYKRFDEMYLLGAARPASCVEEGAAFTANFSPRRHP